jgi:hypothetical protein
MQYQVCVVRQPAPEGVEVFLYTLVTTTNGFVQVITPRTTCSKEDFAATAGNLMKDLLVEVDKAETQTKIWTRADDNNREADSSYAPVK